MAGRASLKGDLVFNVHLGDCVVDGDANGLVEDLDAVDLGRAHGAVLVGA